MTRTSHLKRTAAGLAVVLLPFTTACGGDEEPATEPLPPATDSATPANPPTTPTASPSPGGVLGEGGGELSQEVLEGRIGQEVTIAAEVATILGPNAFTVGGDEVGENPVLVVSATAPQVQEGSSVRVVGQVVRFTVPGVEQDLDIDIVDNEFEDFDGDPVVTATSVTVA
jgi:hypothetical protein